MTQPIVFAYNDAIGLDGALVEVGVASRESKKEVAEVKRPLCPVDF